MDKLNELQQDLQRADDAVQKALRERDLDGWAIAKYWWADLREKIRDLQAAPIQATGI